MEQTLGHLRPVCECLYFQNVFSIWYSVVDSFIRWSVTLIVKVWMIFLLIFWPVGEVRRQRWNLPGNKCDVTIGSNPKHFCWAFPGEIWSKVNSASFYAFVFWSVIPHTLFCWMTLSTLTIWCPCFKWVIFFSWPFAVVIFSQVTINLTVSICCCAPEVPTIWGKFLVWFDIGR